MAESSIKIAKLHFISIKHYSAVYKEIKKSRYIKERKKSNIPNVTHTHMQILRLAEWNFNIRTIILLNAYKGY